MRTIYQPQIIHLFLILLFSLVFLLILLLFGGLYHSSCNPVQIPLTVLADPSSAIIRLLQYTDFFQ
jgi:hypothetical protein